MAFILLGTILGVGGLVPSPAEAQEVSKYSICHATSATNNPYTYENVNASALDGLGQNDHTLHDDPPFDFTDPEANDEWGDIIPPNDILVNGLNWNDATEAIYDNHCNDPVDPCDDDQSTVPTSDDCQPPCDADETTETTADDCTCEELENCPQPRCEDTQTCPVDPCPAPNQQVGDRCYPPCPAGTTRVGDACVGPEVEAEVVTCPAPGTLVNGVCTQPQAQNPPVEVKGVVLTQAPPAAPELPRTGKNMAALVALGMALTVAGGLLVASQRLMGDQP
jgi:LPXTG-motif cell wall-anchored protein